MNIKKLFLSIIAILGLVFAVAFTTYTLTPESSVTTPEIKKTGDYSRPVKDGNCYVQTDSARNKIRVCG